MNWLFCLYTTLIMIISTKEDPTKFIAFYASCSSIKTRQTDKRHHRPDSRLMTLWRIFGCHGWWLGCACGGGRKAFMKFWFGFFSDPIPKAFKLIFLHVEIYPPSKTGSLLLGDGHWMEWTQQSEWWVAKEINCWHKSRSNVNNMANWFNWWWWLE